MKPVRGKKEKRIFKERRRKGLVLGLGVLALTLKFDDYETDSGQDGRRKPAWGERLSRYADGGCIRVRYRHSVKNNRGWSRRVFRGDAPKYAPTETSWRTVMLLWLTVSFHSQPLIKVQGHINKARSERLFSSASL